MARKKVDIEALFPPACTAPEMATILQQLPAQGCKVANPGACSTSYATRCSDAVWWDEEYLMHPKSRTTIAAAVQPKESISSIRRQDIASPQTPLQRRGRRPIAIFVGCNKGYDAVAALRILSKNATYSRASWRQAIMASQNETTPRKGYCGQHSGVDVDVSGFHRRRDNEVHDKDDEDGAIVHCIEPMPATASTLRQAAASLQWNDDRFVVTHAAISNTDGTAQFPNHVHNIGIETPSLGDCTSAKTAKNCETVTVQRLDTFVAAQHVLDDDSSTIDFLSIDTEGYDFNVMLGGWHTIRRTRYVEFEYHMVGLWPRHNLATVIALMREEGFVCYWAGAYGHIWRITDCWHEHYNVHGFSNVACVNINLIDETRPLLNRMEDLFRQTLQAQSNISYAHLSSTFTDGGFRYEEYADMADKDTSHPYPKPKQAQPVKQQSTN